MAPVRILIADDHPLVRSGLRALLGAAEDMEVVGEAATGEEAVTSPQFATGGDRDGPAHARHQWHRSHTPHYASPSANSYPRRHAL